MGVGGVSGGSRIGVGGVGGGSVGGEVGFLPSPTAIPN